MKTLQLNERQTCMLKDFTRFLFKKYPYQAMPVEEIEIRDWRTLSALLRKKLIEYPEVRDHRGMPDMRIDCLRITQLGIDYLKGK